MTWYGNGNYVWFGYGEYCSTVFPGSQDTYTLYSAATPYDISSLTKIKDTNVGVANAAQGTSVPEFNNTGTRAYVGCRGGADAAVLIQHNLSKPFDLSTRINSASITASDSYDHISLRIERNGQYLYTGCHSPDIISVYILTTPWDITSAVFVQNIETNLPVSQAFNGLFIAEPGYY
jgi:hypothetical protein